MRRIVREHGFEAVVIAIPSLSPVTLNALVREATDAGTHVRFLPSFLSAVERVARAADMRTVRYSTLLGRQERRILQPAAGAPPAGAPGRRFDRPGAVPPGPQL
jgi:FlaA1/EpsC-like NDP-sugar epimerase